MGEPGTETAKDNPSTPIGPNIFQRINSVRQDIDGYLQKLKQVQNYKVVTHDQVTHELRTALLRRGVIVFPNLAKSLMVDTGNKTQSGRGVPIFRYEAKYSVGFINMDNPSDTAWLDVEAHSLDQGDKAPGKALSMATKSAMLKVFTIVTGEDEESPYDPAPAYISEDQVADLKSLLTEIGREPTTLCERMKIGSLNEITIERYEAAVNFLERQREKLKEQPDE